MVVRFSPEGLVENSRWQATRRHRNSPNLRMSPRGGDRKRRTHPDRQIARQIGGLGSGKGRTHPYGFEFRCYLGPVPLVALR